MFQGDIDEIEELMKSREMSYADYIQTSSDKYQSSDNQVDRNSPQPSGGLLGSLGKMFSSGKKWFINIFFTNYYWNYILQIWWIQMKSCKCLHGTIHIPTY